MRRKKLGTEKIRRRVVAYENADYGAVARMWEPPAAYFRHVKCPPSRLKYIRKCYGETQAQFASRLGVSVTTLSNWESGYTVPSESHFEKIDDLAWAAPMPKRSGTILPADIQRLRSTWKHSQVQFAAFLGVSRQTIIRWESGQSAPTGEAAKMLSMLIATLDTPEEK